MGRGYESEKKCVKLLEEAGYKAHRKIHTRWHKDDLFGLFDIVALDDKRVKLIQVTTNATRGKKKEIKEAEFLPVGKRSIQIELWVRYTYNGWRVCRLYKKGWKDIVDERGFNCNMGSLVVDNI